MLEIDVPTAHGQAHDFATADAFPALEAKAVILTVPDALMFDTVNVDEGQDWLDSWRDIVFCHARDDACMIWLEDPLQNLW
jgi:superfamily I DNA and RNA helicase